MHMSVSLFTMLQYMAFDYMWVFNLVTTPVIFAASAISAIKRSSKQLKAGKWERPHNSNFSLMPLAALWEGSKLKQKK